MFQYAQIERGDPIFALLLPTPSPACRNGNGNGNDFAIDRRRPLEFGLHAPSITLWFQLLSLVIANALAAAALSVVVKRLILDDRRRKKMTTTSTTTTVHPKRVKGYMPDWQSRWDGARPYVIGYGILIPLVVACPFYTLSILRVQNALLRFSGGCIVPTLSMFRISEAIHGFEPPHATRSTAAYALYFASPLELRYDPKNGTYVRSCAADLQGHVLRFALAVATVGTYLSLLLPFDLEPLTSTYATEEWYSLHRLVNWAQLGNNFLHALLFQVMLTCFFEGLALATCLVLGFKAKVSMDNPILSSTSPSQFWGKKWNTLIHGVLKRGVFKPVMKHFPSKAVAAIATFVASGIFHEWIIVAVFLTPIDEFGKDGGTKCVSSDCFSKKLGGSTLFFLWSAILIILEAAIGHWPLFHWIKKSFPQPIVTFMVIMLALPLAHWFSDPYIKMGFFEDTSVGFPLLLPIQRDGMS